MASINATQALAVEQLSSHILRLDSGNYQQPRMMKGSSNRSRISCSSGNEDPQALGLTSVICVWMGDMCAVCADIQLVLTHPASCRTA
eukprot:6576-Heterococcus_DN1.PRE.1